MLKQIISEILHGLYAMFSIVKVYFIHNHQFIDIFLFISCSLFVIIIGLVLGLILRGGWRYHKFTKKQQRFIKHFEMAGALFGFLGGILFSRIIFTDFTDSYYFISSLGGAFISNALGYYLASLLIYHFRFYEKEEDAMLQEARIWKQAVNRTQEELRRQEEARRQEARQQQETIRLAEIKRQEALKRQQEVNNIQNLKPKEGLKERLDETDRRDQARRNELQINSQKNSINREADPKKRESKRREEVTSIQKLKQEQEESKRREEATRIQKLKQEQEELKRREEAARISFKENWVSYQDIIQRNSISKLYHFTDRKNIPSIKQNGGLLSWYYCKRNGIEILKPGGSLSSRSLDTNKGLQNYVRISFVRSHPMMHVAQNDGRITDPVILEINPEVIYFRDTIFTNQNAAKNGVGALGTLEKFDSIRFPIFRQNYFNLSEVDRSYYQAEVLVLGKIPLEFIANINHF